MKRNRPEAEHKESEEGGLPRPRASEAYSNSSCDSGALDVQRIHSGLPAPAWKTEGATCEVPLRQDRSGHRSDDSDGRIADCIHVVDQDTDRFPGFGGRPDDSVEDLQKCLPQAFTKPARNSPRQTGQFILYPKAHHHATSRGEASTGHRSTIQQRHGAFTTLTQTALQQQLKLLEGDKQALLAELRTLRREYDARVAALQQQHPHSQQHQQHITTAASSSRQRQLQPASLCPSHHLPASAAAGALSLHLSVDHGHPLYLRPMKPPNERQLYSPKNRASLPNPVTQSALHFREEARLGGPAPKGLMLPPRPPPLARAQPQDREQKPAAAPRPVVDLSMPPLCEEQMAAPGSLPTRQEPVPPRRCAGAAAAPTTGGSRAPEMPLQLQLQPASPSDFGAEAGGAASGAAFLTPLPPDVLESLLLNGDSSGGGGGGGALMATLMAQLVQRSRQQQATAAGTAAELH